MNSGIKKCEKCGSNNNYENKYCNNCGNELSVNNSLENNTSFENEKTNVEVKDKIGEKLGVISLLLYFVGPMILSLFNYVLANQYVSYIISPFVGVCPLSGIVIMIIGRIKYPNNKLLKIAMWIIIVSIIFSIISAIIILISCINAMQNCN